MRSLPDPDPEMEALAHIEVGCRVSVGGAPATVEYVGPVQGTAGIWIGVRWDDAGRGKHDGLASGVRYFTSPGENSASFVRPQKLDSFSTCAEAIRAYYAEKEDEPSAAFHRAVIEDWKKKIKVPFIQMVGFDSVQEKQGTLDRLLEACVSDRRIRAAGDLAQLCPSLRILDISKNLFHNWDSIAQVVMQLNRLEVLDLSKNRLKMPSDDEAARLSVHFKNLKKITMTHSELDWDHVLKIFILCPNTEEAVFAYNKISAIPPSPTITDFGKLSSITLDGNPIRNWKEILTLGTSRALKTLSLNDCSLSEIMFDDNYEGEKTDLFQNVETLYLKQNLIDNWRSISELDKLRKLSKLFISKNPLILMDNYDTCSQLIIARIGNLKELNSSEITKEIRRGAEYDYIKKYGLQWKEILKTNTEQIKSFALENSRFDYLIKKHGLPDENLLILKAPMWAINTNLLDIFIKDDFSGLTIRKKLPSTMTVQKLIALARKLFASKTKAANSAVNPGLFALRTNHDKSEVQVHLDNQMKELNFYSIASGETILIKW